MRITYYGHACFAVEAEGYRVVLDPYVDGYVPGLGNLRLEANAVLCSHGHGDHNAAEVVTVVPYAGEPPVKVTRVQSAHDDVGGAKRGMNEMTVLEAEGLRACHLGDLGEQLSAAQLAAIGPVDVVMVPVGGYYTIDADGAQRVVEALGARVVIPMHYSGAGFGFDEVVDTLDKFLALRDDVVRADRGYVDVARGAEKETLVLRGEMEPA